MSYDFSASYGSSTNEGKEAMKEIVQEAVQEAGAKFAAEAGTTLSVVLDEREREKKETTVVISSASVAMAKLLYNRAGLIIEDGLPLQLEPSDRQFVPFDWNDKSESERTPIARNYLETELAKFNVRFGRGGFKLVDIHSDNSILNLSDEKIGKISGGSDFMIVPYTTACESYSACASVLFELKTSKVIEEAGFQRYVPQGLFEFLSARCLSNQPGVLVILTDLSSGAMSFDMSYVPEDNSFVVRKYTLTLDGMATMVSKFLTETAVPRASYRPREERNDPRETTVIAFKKMKMSNDMGLAWEHYNDMVDDTKPWSRERVQLVQELFNSFSDVERTPSILQYASSMYV
jgi:hypothetical protein